MNIGLIVVIVIVVLIALYLMTTYNSFVTLSNKIKEAYSTMDVYLKKRYDLIPNLVETVKGYAKHESGVFEEVTKARASVMDATNVKEASEANNMLTESLKSLFAVAENYPELKASSNFQDLQNKLSETEDKIAYSRQFYNDTVLMYNNKCQMFPSSIIASLFKFNEEDFFEAESTSRSVPKVDF